MERRSSAAVDILGKQSLLTALNRFVTAVNAMDDIVMIPSRLRDLEGPMPGIAEVNNNNHDKNVNEQTALAVPSLQGGSDLYRCFSMLHVIRDEIIAGTKPDEEGESGASGEGEDSEEDEETAARNTANMFRYHLRGLFSLLHQLTATAQYLGSRYERDVTQKQSTFSLNM